MSPVPALIAHKPRIIGDRYSASAKKKQKTKIDNYREYIIGRTKNDILFNNRCNTYWPCRICE